MATYTLAAADALLKDMYVGPIIEQLNNKTYMLDQIERDSDHLDHTGRRAIFPVHANRNRGRGSRGDNANLPVPGYNTDVDAIVPIRYHYYGMEISDPTIEASKNNAGAFANLLERESKGIAKDMRKDMNRQIFGDGTGLLTSVRAASTSTTVNVDSVQYIGVGDTVDVLVKSTGAVTNGVQSALVTARDTTAGAQTITIGTALAGSCDTTYGVYIAGSRVNEVDGLRNIISTGRTLHSINSSTAGNEFWNAKSRAAGSNVAGETLFEQLADDVGGGGNGDVDVFVTTRGIKRRLADTYQSQKRFNDARATTIHGGYTAIWVNEVPVVADDDAPKGYAFGINKDSFRWAEQTKPGWLEQKDGAVFQLKDGSTAGTKMNVWQAWFRWYSNLANQAPNRNGVISGADDDTAT
jgi:hypothetical protein